MTQLSGAQVGALQVLLGVDQTGLDRGLQDAEGKTKSFGGRIGGAMGKVGKVMGAAVLAGVVAAGAGLAAFSKKALSVASDLEEVQNVVDTVFGSSAKQIEDFAETAGTKFGLSELAAKQFSGTMGALLTPTGLASDEIANMSESMVGLAGDMASFYNLDPADAFNKLRAGISGETEPLKQLGINMSVANLEAFALSQGIDKTFNSMTQAEQATLRYNFLMEATSIVQGDFAKTSESLANQQRIMALNTENLAKTFGNVLLPQAGKAMLGMNSLITMLMPSFESLATGLGEMLDGSSLGEARFQAAADNIVDGLMKGLEGALPKVLQVLTALIPVIVRTLALLIPKLVQMIGSQIPLLINAFVGLLPMIVETILSFIPVLIQLGMDILTALVAGIIESIPVLIEMIPTLLTMISNLISDNMGLIINLGLDILRALVEGILLALPILIEMIPNIIDEIVYGLVEGIGYLIEAGVQLLVGLIEGIVAALPALAAQIPEIIQTIVRNLLFLLPVIITAAMDIMLALIMGLVTAIPLLVEMIPQIIDNIVTTLIENLPAIIDAAIAIIVAIATALIENIPMLIESIITIGASLVRGVLDLIPALWEAGKDLINGVLDGLKSVDVGAALKQIGDSIVGGLKALLGIDSPSKVLRDKIGKWIIPGITEGMEMGLPDLKRGLGDAADLLVGGLQLPGAAGAAGGGDMIFEIQVSLQSGSPDEARRAGEIIAETANDRLIAAARRRGRA